MPVIVFMPLLRLSLNWPLTSDLFILSFLTLTHWMPTRLTLVHHSFAAQLIYLSWRLCPWCDHSKSLMFLWWSLKVYSLLTSILFTAPPYSLFTGCECADHPLSSSIADRHCFPSFTDSIVLRAQALLINIVLRHLQLVSGMIVFQAQTLLIDVVPRHSQHISFDRAPACQVQNAWALGLLRQV